MTYAVYQPRAPKDHINPYHPTDTYESTRQVSPSTSSGTLIKQMVRDSVGMYESQGRLPPQSNGFRLIALFGGISLNEPFEFYCVG